MEQKSFSLPITTVERAVEAAKLDVKEGIRYHDTGEQPGLYTRWDNINKRLLNGFRFGNIYLIAGPSGHGKSYVLNMMLSDFCNKDINGNFKKPFKVLHFNFEMSSSDEVLRTLSNSTKISYSDLLSSERRLTDTEYQDVEEKLEKIKDHEVYFVEKPVAELVKKLTENCIECEKKLAESSGIQKN